MRKGLLARLFRRPEPDPASPVEDELLGHVQRGVIAAIGSLQQQINTLATQMKVLDENATTARALEQRLGRLDTLATTTRGLLEQEVARIDAATNHLRGQVTGGSRGGRGDRAAADIGRALVEVLGSQERAAQLIEELHQRQSQNGQGEIPLPRNDVFA